MGSILSNLNCSVFTKNTKLIKITYIDRYTLMNQWFRTTNELFRNGVNGPFQLDEAELDKAELKEGRQAHWIRVLNLCKLRARPCHRTVTPAAVRQSHFGLRAFESWLLNSR